MFIYFIINVIKQTPNRDGPYTDSPDWIKNKKVTLNPINRKDNKYFQYVITVVLNQGEINKDPQRMTKRKPFIYKYNWEGINFASEKNDWKNLRKIM